MSRESAFRLAKKFVGRKEVPGTLDNPLILAMLKLDNEWPEHDEVPWCSAFVNWICFLADLPRSKSLRARSWLNVGSAIPLGAAFKGDIIVLQRGAGEQPGPSVIDAPGHVGFFAGTLDSYVKVLGGNQADQVKVSNYQVSRILSVRRLA